MPEAGEDLKRLRCPRCLRRLETLMGRTWDAHEGAHEDAHVDAHEDAHEDAHGTHMKTWRRRLSDPERNGQPVFAYSWNKSYRK